ncbi:MAG: toll/interleukin-1 receptor domain-containing protein [Ferruginibacter sp.]
MQLLSEIKIPRSSGEAVIQLLQGDLTAIPKEHATDILVISAYPGSYVPVNKTLMAALYNKGILVGELAKNKEIDLLEQLGCWLSRPLSEEQQEIFHFEQILCFEPCLHTNQQETIVGNIFRCINTCAFNERINVIAMPVLASGCQKVPLQKMLPAILDAGIFWLDSGLPLNCIKLVLHSDEQVGEAFPIFERAREQNELKNSVNEGDMRGLEALRIMKESDKSMPQGEETMPMVESTIIDMAREEIKKEHPAPPPAMNGIYEEQGESMEGYDYFISYAHTHSSLVNSFVKSILERHRQIKLFYDRSSIPAGGLWIKQISDAIQKAKKVLIFLSPDYNKSMVCWDEFQCAKLIEYNSRKPIIQTIYLYNDTALPPMMGIYSWIDCREGNVESFKECIDKLIPSEVA